ncbi:MAG: ABC transporter permease subunit, partial [Treponema sp.]|nr:ABC transporter permease subunit [Treponema sp.]
LRSATGYAIIETLFALGIVFAYSFVIRQSQKNGYGMEYKAHKTKSRKAGLFEQRIDLPGIGCAPFHTKHQRFFEISLFIFISILILLFFWAPAFSILISGLQQKKGGTDFFTFAQFISLFKNQNFWKAFFNSIWIGYLTGLLCAFFGFAWSLFVKLSGRQANPVFQTIPLVPMAVSSVVISWLATLIFHRGNPVILILLQVFLYWPIAYRQIQNGINSISKDTDRAALLFSKNRLDSIIRVYLPSCRRFIISGFAYSFAVSLGDATLPLVLAIPKFDTLALYVYKLASSYRFNQSCACGVLLTVLCLVVFSSSQRTKED